MDNAMDNLLYLYADAKNLALLNEAVMNLPRIVSEEASERISFTDFPCHVAKDLMVAVSRNKKGKLRGGNQNGNNLPRKKLDEKGFPVDGSRETMIETIKNSATDSEA